MQAEPPPSWAAVLGRALGEVGLLPDVFWRMTWAEYDAAVYSHELRTQQAADGHRVVATLLFNAWFTNSDAKNGPVVAPKLPAEFWSLPLLDKASPPPATPAETPAQTWARLQALGLLS